MGEVAASDYFTEQGEIKGRKEVLFELGRLKFGDTDETIEAALKSIADLDRLKRMGKAILTTNSWEELLSTP
jgi:transcription termination factor NusB